MPHQPRSAESDPATTGIENNPDQSQEPSAEVKGSPGPSTKGDPLQSEFLERMGVEAELMHESISFLERLSVSKKQSQENRAEPEKNAEGNAGLNKPKAQEEPTPVISGEELKKYVDAERQGVDGVLGLSKSTVAEVEKLLDELSNLKPENQRGLTEMNRLVEKATDIIVFLRNNLAQARAVKAEVLRHIDSSLNERLQSDGLASVDDLWSRYRKVTDGYSGSLRDIRSLERKFLGLGRIFKRNEIRSIRGRRADLGTELEGLREAVNIDSLRSRFTGFDYDFPVDERVLTDKLARTVSDKIKARIASLGEQSRVRTEGNEDFSAEQNRELQDAYIDQEIMPLFTKALPEYRDDARKREALNHARRTLQKILVKPTQFYFSGFQTEERERQREEDLVQAKELEKEIESFELPIDAKMVLRDAFRHDGGKGKLLEDYSRFIGNFPNLQKNVAVARLGKEVAEHFQTTSRSIKFYGDFGAPEDESGEDKLGSFTESLDTGYWQFLRDKLKGSPMGEIAEAVDRAIGKKILDQLKATESHTPESNNLGGKLYKFYSPDIAPFAVLNAYRESGFSGEQPFIYAIGAPNETILYKYLLGITTGQLEELKQKNIPGLLEVIDLIKKHGEDFNSKELFVDTARIPNPAFAEISKNLTRMALHYFESGNADERLFVADFLLSDNYLDIDRGEVSKRVAEIVGKSGGGESNSRVLSYFLEKARTLSNIDALRFLDECYKENPSVRGEIELGNPRIGLMLKHNLFPLLEKAHERGIYNSIISEVDRLVEIPPDRREIYVDILTKIFDSPSQEIKRIAEPLTREILKTEDPMLVYGEIEDIFIKNHLPIVGKIYKVFEKLFPPDKLEELVKSNPQISPVLQGASRRRREKIIWEDLLRVHIGSGNRSLRNVVDIFHDGEETLKLAEANGFGSLTKDQHDQMESLFAKMETILMSSALGREVKPTELGQSVDLGEFYKKLRSEFRVADGQPLSDRLAEMYLRPLGIQSFAELQAFMREAKQKAGERGLAYAASGRIPEIKVGDLTKGVDDQYIADMLQNGAVAKEFLGASSGQDMTPLDTDLSMVIEGDTANGLESTLKNSMATNYGDLLFVVKDRGQFQKTKNGEPAKYNAKKYELFSSSDGGGRHSGIRTGFPTTEIDFMIVKGDLKTDTDKLQKIYFEIAKNGFYVPVFDDSGNIVFTPETYTQYRKTFDGVDYFDGEPYSVDREDYRGILKEDLDNVKNRISGDAERNARAMETISAGIGEVLGRSNVHLNSKYESSILGAELQETGSTARNANLPGDMDFDLALRLDAHDFQNAAEIASAVKQIFSFAEDISHSDQTGGYQVRLKGVKSIGGKELEQPIGVDIAFASKSEITDYSTNQALEDRYAWIRSHLGEEDYRLVLSNVVLAKKLLKEGGAYKKFEDGGLGGVGVENWILAHGGNIRKAFESFEKAAYENGVLVPLTEFQQRYKILDPGVNLKFMKHDNFAMNIKEGGYQAMLETIRNYLNRSGK